MRANDPSSPTSGQTPAGGGPSGAGPDRKRAPSDTAQPSKSSAVPAGAVTPMMAQYLEIKAAHEGYLLFYRMGDFYELFFEDAVTAAEALSITLTKRGKHQGADIAMCGVPVHSADSYLQELIRKGFKVAVCEQTEDPAEAKKRGAKAVVRREVQRLVTAGTLTEDTLLNARSHNYLCAAFGLKGGNEAALAWLDMSTGAFFTMALAPDELGAQLARIDPREILLPDRLLQSPDYFELWGQYKAQLTPMPDHRFSADGGAARLKSGLGVAALDGYGAFTRAETAAAGALLDYLDLTQKGRMPDLQPPQQVRGPEAMQIDAATRTSLELTRTQTGERKGSLLHHMDRTLTAAGARELAARLSAPLTDPARINARLDAVDHLAGDAGLRDRLRDILRQAPDLERPLGRLTLDRGAPRDLAAIRDGLTAAREIRQALIHAAKPLSGALPADLQEAMDRIGDWTTRLTDPLSAALAETLPALVRDGDFIRAGYHAPLDELRQLRDESRKVIAGLQAKYQAMTEVKSLKIKHNNVLGYFIEVTAAHAERLMMAPLNATLIHRQTLANAGRFTTTELSHLEQRMDKAASQAMALEKQLFEELRGRVAEAAAPIRSAAQGLAAIDVAAGLALLAHEQGYVRPQIDDSRVFEISGGRHPVVEAALPSGGGGFVPNDCTLTAEGEAGRLWLVTGPNMAGKSTFLRQNALIAVMAQMGAPVPARNAHIGVVDRLFSRVGASDDLARGRSTFMVEMIETAAILNQAGPRALVILDEIGRGTATYDGLSIAWAALEFLHERNKCRGLFATHYHELTALSQKLSGLTNVSMKVREWKGEVVFLHEVVPGAADRSYGIQVARLAGLPGVAVRRAEAVLHQLEESESAQRRKMLIDDLPLFAAFAEEVAEAAAAEPAALAELKALDVDALSPREALETLYRLKADLLAEGT